jgi:SAM-dependent methyltransferase
MRKTIVASLLPRAYPVLLGFAATDVRSFFLAPIRGTDAPTSEQLDAASARGLTIASDADRFAAVDGGSIADEARARFERVFASAAFAAAVDALPPRERNAMPPHLARIAPQAFADAIALIDVLDDLAARADVRGVIVSEDASSSTRTLVRWARARGIPSVQLTHGASPLYTLFSANFLVDDHYVYGEHIFPSLADAGVGPDRLHIGTFYGHDEHAHPVPGARAAFRARFEIPDDDVVVALALGFNAFSTAFEPSGFWFLNVLTAFVEAVRLLRDRGIRCTPVIKHRWPDPQVEALTRDAARRFDLTVHYVDGSMAELLPGIDVLCASDSNTLIEATLYDCAVLDVVYPWHWHIGPQYALDDRVPYADARYPGRIADALAPLIEPGLRRAQIDARKARSRRVVADTSRGIDGIARDLVAILERRRTTLPDSVPVPRAAPLDALSAVPDDARRILDATGAPESLPLLQSLYPGAAIDTDGTREHDVAVAGYALARAHRPDALLASLRDALAPDGCIVAQFPNARNLRYLNDVLDDRPWSGRRIGRDGEAMPMMLHDVLALFDAHGFAAETVRLRADRALAMPDTELPETSNIAAGRLVIDATVAADRREYQAADFVVVARRKR